MENQDRREAQGMHTPPEEEAQLWGGDVRSGGGCAWQCLRDCVFLCQGVHSFNLLSIFFVPTTVFIDKVWVLLELTFLSEKEPIKQTNQSINIKSNNRQR